jgi:hypothetical protein
MAFLVVFHAELHGDTQVVDRISLVPIADFFPSRNVE